MGALDPRCRLPLLDLALAELSSLAAAQRRTFLALLDTLIRADQRITLQEFVIQVIMENGLRPDAARSREVKFKALDDVGAEAALLLSLLAHAGADGGDAAAVQNAFARGAEKLGLRETPALLRIEQVSLTLVARALERLSALAPLRKPAVILACVECVQADGVVRVTEMEILRALAAAIDCPLPPQLSQAQLAA